MKMKYLLLVLLISVASSTLFSQERMLMMSQYLHNQYMLNSAFGGSREVLSLFGSYRQQFAGSPYSPSSQSFTAHAPLKNEHLALGLAIHNENYKLYSGTKATMSYTYRLITEKGNKIAFSLNGGFMTYGWGVGDNIDLIDPNDPTYQNWKGEIDHRFALGFGTAWYGKNFFLGFSVYDFFYRAPFLPENTFFSLGNSTYIFTGGYLFEISETLQLQPSALLNLERIGTTADISVSAILINTLWAGITFRTNKEYVGIVGWQVTPQLKVTYSYDFPTGDLKKFSAGSHEISLQFDFGYKIYTSSPKFF